MRKAKVLIKSEASSITSYAMNSNHPPALAKSWIKSSRISGGAFLLVKLNLFLTYRTSICLTAFDGELGFRPMKDVNNRNSLQQVLESSFQT
jgi:hypothetical protein